MHNNPVRRGLVSSPGVWPWSSWRYYYLNDVSVLRLDRLDWAGSTDLSLRDIADSKTRSLRQPATPAFIVKWFRDTMRHVLTELGQCYFNNYVTGDLIFGANLTRPRFWRRTFQSPSTSWKISL